MCRSVCRYTLDCASLPLVQAVAIEACKCLAAGAAHAAVQTARRKFQMKE